MLATEVGETLYNDFQSDAHRRVLGNLAQPRSARDLLRFLRGAGWPYASHDPHLAELIGDEQNELTEDEALKRLGAVLADLEKDGLVKVLGEFEPAAPKRKARRAAGEALVKAIREDGDVPSLPKEKAAALVERIAHRRRHPFVESGPQYYLTERGLAKLRGPVVNEPPPLELDEEDE